MSGGTVAKSLRVLLHVLRDLRRQLRVRPRVGSLVVFALLVGAACIDAAVMYFLGPCVRLLRQNLGSYPQEVSLCM